MTYNTQIAILNQHASANLVFRVPVALEEFERMTIATSRSLLNPSLNYSSH